MQPGSVNLKQPGVDKQIRVLVPALVTCMESTSNVNLLSCATAALINLSCDHDTTKILIMQTGCMKLLIKQLKSKDDDLILYTLYLLVNMTKTPQHRSIVTKEGGLPVLVDILTSNYQNLEKTKLLAEFCSVVGQLCNDPETRGLISIEYLMVIDCLLWINDATEPNTELKSRLLFCLRQLCGQEQNKIKVGQHIIYSVMQELGTAKGGVHEECTNNMIMLLKVLAQHVNRNAKEINETILERLQDCKFLDENNNVINKRKFNSKICENIQDLRGIIRSANIAG